ncbi:GH12 family glycosyl hydrolase domain-containing protein [Kitasatospora kifunensis]|uniref:Endoglucanase n=1 Tax=Kitasatospora kifunensis TaxID=58351 RepID=A0A7W7R9U1_KITKI|nr:RICIN domain-containing protein [Kitasatospora kifunensis]MBB4928090.1 endoglucanase [Kitasatospora kifunensis]
MPGFVAALLAALLLSTLSPAGAAPASADSTICDQFGTATVSGGKYIVQNNEWGDSIQQCINVGDDGFTVTTGNHNVSTSGAPAAYPSIYAGCHYGNCSTGDGLPLQVSAFANPQSSVDFTTAPGDFDASYDIWFDTNPNPAGQNDGEELMIWANHFGPSTPFGTKVGTVYLEGANWDVWYGRQGSSPAWNTVSYVRQQPTNAITVNIKDFTDDSINSGWLQPSWYLTSVQFGFEPWVGGPGLAVNSFSFDPNGSGGTSGTLVGQGSGRCADLQGLGTADGTPVQLWDCSGAWNQNWTSTAGTVVNPQSGKCLDVAGGGTADGTQVRLWSCNGTGAQQWQFNADGTVTNPQSGKCLDAAGSGNGALLQIWDCYGGGTRPNQVWSLT